MIINTGNRTDIPAYFSDWFFTRIEQGYVCMRNPCFPAQVTRYRLDPSVVDCLVFCTKNPRPMLSRSGKLDAFGQYWFVTITPYGKEIEPNVPDKWEVISDFQELSRRKGKNAVCWRYDPIFLSETYSYEFHLDTFEQMAAALSGYTPVCVISFIDLYEKTLRNLKGVKRVEREMQKKIVQAFVQIGRRYGIGIKTCAQEAGLAQYGADTRGCLTKEVLEDALLESLSVRGIGRARKACPCLLGNDIGMYNTCGHGCLYCYANYDSETVAENRKMHDPLSPFLVGGPRREDVLRDAVQERFRSGQLRLYL